jgi:hypothetical protein
MTISKISKNQLKPFDLKLVDLKFVDLKLFDLKLFDLKFFDFKFFTIFFACVFAAMQSPSSQAEPLVVSKAADMRQAMDDVALAAANHDLVLVKLQPIDTALTKRGFEDPGMRILFIGSESAVRWAEAAEPRLLNLLPLRLTMIKRGDEVMLVSDDFGQWLQEFPDAPARLMIEAWQAEMQAMLDDFVWQ